MSEATQALRARYLAVNGDHAMTAEDDVYVCSHFVPLSARHVLAVLAGRLPLPSYYLSDGTAMVRRDHAEALDAGLGGFHEWFVSWWPEDPGAGEEQWQGYLSGRLVHLRSVTPTSIRRLAALTAQVEAGVAKLEGDPADPVGRGMVGEAVAVLDELLAPMTAYDRLRFGGATVRECLVDAVRARYLTPTPPPVPLKTDRLVLRVFAPGDAPAYARYHGRADVAALLLQGPLNPAEAAAEVSYRATETAPGGPGDRLSLAVERDGELVGDVVLELHGPDLSTAELGWIFDPAVHGQGLATEAARALTALAFTHYGVHRVYADLDARNDRSAALCERLGMRRELHGLQDFWSRGEWTDSYRYAVLRGEWDRRVS